MKTIQRSNCVSYCSCTQQGSDDEESNDDDDDVDEPPPQKVVFNGFYLLGALVFT